LSYNSNYKVQEQSSITIQEKEQSRLKKKLVVGAMYQKTLESAMLRCCRECKCHCGMCKSAT